MIITRPTPRTCWPNCRSRGSPSPVPLVEAVHEAGWSAVRIKRLRDVEWAAKLHEPWPLGWLEQRPRYTLVACA